MNLFLTVIFFYAWLENLTSWSTHGDFLFVEGSIIILCGLYQGTVLDLIYWKEDQP